MKKNCLNGWNRYRTNPKIILRSYQPCGCCNDCMQLKGGHYCKPTKSNKGNVK